jgi:dipeptidyl aminopeptidase/acylaminoacyl peptidase
MPVLLHRIISLFLVALVLAACGGGTPVVESATTAAPQSAAMTPQRSTLALPATMPSAPTIAPEPTTAPATVPSAPTIAPEPTTAPATAPTASLTTPPTAPATPPASISASTQASQPATSIGSELLFLRKGSLIAFDTGTRKERQIANGVHDFAATSDGAFLALIRGVGRQAELWLVRRDGSALTQLTGNDRAEATPSWAPDGGALAFASAATEQPFTREWQPWSAWCAASQVHLLNIADLSETSFGPGCDPAFSPDGKRIAYAAPPTAKEPDFPDPAPLVVNSIRLINRQGQNGWDFAKARGATAPPPHTGRVVYAPAWSPDAKQVVYQRFLGYQALVDLDITEIAGSFDGKGKPLGDGAGWLLPARFAPTGQSLAITENNVGDARGFGGYDNWSVSVIRLDGTREIALPSGSIQAIGQRVDRLPRGQSVAWSPDGAVLAVELPPGWNPRLSLDQPINADGQPGEIWRWKPGEQPAERLVKDVDFASPLAWLAPSR